MPSVLVTVSPKPAKYARTHELLTWATDQIEKTEDSIRQYHTYETSGSEEGTVDFLVHFKISDESGLESRRDLQHHKTIAKAIKEEDLLRKPMEYKVLKDVGGWKR